MANKLITPSFRTHIANQFKESFSESANTIYYMFAAKSTPYENEPTVPDATADIDTVLYQTFDELIFGKHITPTDVSSMLREVSWTTNTIYDIYDGADALLETKDFYVVVFENGNSYNVFKCLNNSGGAPSTAAPSLSETSADDELYQTGDGYQWKYMFSIPVSSYNKFAANDFIPIVANTTVQAAAANGAIETIVVENPGINYNSYAEGRIKEAAVSGNTLAYSLSGEKFRDVELVLNMTPTANSFSDYLNEKVTSTDSNGKVARGIVVDIDTSNNKLRLHRVRGTFKPGVIAIGSSSNTHGTILSVTRLTEDISANTDFYKNNSIYITSGDAAGQVRTVTEYSVTGDDRLVYVNAPFDPIPDQQDDFYIGPRVLIDGDGEGAVAIANIDESANSVLSIEVVSRGANYSYANVSIIANTGLQDVGGVSITANTASVRAILAPQGGHGSNPIEELFSTRVGVGVEFANTESNTISVENDFRKVGILKEPRFANTVLTVVSTTAIVDGLTLTQNTSGATATVSARNVDGTGTLRVNNIRGFFVTGQDVVASNSTNSSIASTSVTAIDRSIETFEQMYKYTVTIIDNGDGTSFSEDDYVFQEQTLSSGYIHSIKTVSGTTTISLVDVKGNFSISDAATGSTQTFRNNDGAEAELTGEIKPDLHDNQGQVIYIENGEAISRASNQTEKLKLILEF